MDIGAWLRDWGLERYEQVFRENDIAPVVLRELTDRDLKDLGVSLGHRRLLLKAIRALTDGHSIAESAQAADAPPQPALRSEAERLELQSAVLRPGRLDRNLGRARPRGHARGDPAYQSRCASRCVARGSYAKFMGDGVLAYFGFPRAHEDDAERAVRAGLDLILAVGRLGTAVVSRRYRVGIDTGFVVVGDLIGEGAAQEQAVIGETPNLAARLQGFADPNRVIISPEHAPVGRRAVFEYEDLGTHDLKGVRGEVAGVAGDRRRPRSRAASRPRRSPHSRPSSAGMQELCRADGPLAASQGWRRAGGPAVRGNRGSAKAGSPQRLRERIGDRGMRASELSVQARITRSRALYPIIRHFEHAAGLARSEPGWANLATDGGADCAGRCCVVSEVAPLFAELAVDPDPPIPSFQSPSAQKQKATHAPRSGGPRDRALPGEQPVVVIFEDVHWIDPTSQEVLDLLVPRDVQQRILLVITHRPEYRAALVGIGARHDLARPHPSRARPGGSDGPRGGRGQVAA